MKNLPDTCPGGRQGWVGVAPLARDSQMCGSSSFGPRSGDKSRHLEMAKWILTGQLNAFREQLKGGRGNYDGSPKGNYPEFWVFFLFIGKSLSQGRLKGISGDNGSFPL